MDEGGKKHKYGLAKARNMGIIEAEGKVIVFCDSRLKPESDAVYWFTKKVLRRLEKVWYFGDKGAGKRSFVENFSAIRRKLLITGGMFNERINRYGGMTQEISTRFGKHGFRFVYVPEAKATPILKASKRGRKPNIWRSKLKLWKMYG